MMGAAFRYSDQRLPHQILADATPMSRANHDEISLIVLLSLDAAQRGMANTSMVNRLIEHSIAAYILWAKQGNEALVATGHAGYMALTAAVARSQGHDVGLTGKEYQALRAVLWPYLQQMKVLPCATVAKVYKMALERVAA